MGSLIGCNGDGLADWAKLPIKRTLDFYGKTEDQLWADVDEQTQLFEQHMQKIGPAPEL